MDGTAGVEAHLEADGVTFTARDAELLRAIDEHGSLNAACATLGRSFAHSQRRVVELEEAFGSLVERTRGGRGGGGSELAAAAHDLLGRFDRLAAEGAGLVAVDRTTLRGPVVDRDGELGTVDTPAGRVRALVPPGAETVAVSVRSDAVALHDPPGPETTSALNRFRGTVVDVAQGDAVATVTLQVSPEVSLEALLSAESTARLDLATGAELVATFKATATRAVPAPTVTPEEGTDPPHDGDDA